MDGWIDKPLAVCLQAGAAFMFAAAGAIGGDAVLLFLPAVASGAAGLLLWGRAARASPLADEGSTLQGEGARVAELLRSLQEDVARLREDREFYRELYGQPTRRPPALPGGPEM